VKAAISQFFTVFLIFVVAAQPAFTYASQESQSEPTQAMSQVAPSGLQTSDLPKNFSEAFGGLPLDIQERITTDILSLYAEMLEWQQELESQYGEKGLVDILDRGGRDSQDKVVVETRVRPGVGKAEFYVIEGETFVRIVHELSDVAIFIIDNPNIQFDPKKMDEVFYESPRALLPTLYDPAKEALQESIEASRIKTAHMKTIVARQHKFTNSPAPGIYNGRDVAILRINRVCSTVECQLAPKPPRFSRQNLIEYFRGLRSKGNKYDLVLGTLLGSFQASALYSIAQAANHLESFDSLASFIGAHKEVTPEMIHVALGFGLVTTLIKTTFDNWRNLGSPNLNNFNTQKIDGTLIDLSAPGKTVSNLIKKSGVYQTLTSQQMRRVLLSYAHRTSLVFYSQEASSIDISFESLFGLAQLTGNIILGGYMTYWAEQPAHIRAKLRMNKKPLFKGPVGETLASAKNRFQMELFEKQIRYNAAWILGMVDFMNVTSVEIPVIGSVSLWKITMLAMAGFYRHRAVMMAERLSSPSAPQMREEFENTWYMRTFRKIFSENPVGQYALAYHKTFIQPKLDTVVKPAESAASGVKRFCNIHLSTNF
jgi:hypothetical protein